MKVVGHRLDHTYIVDIHIHMYMYVCMYVCMYVYIYTYIHPICIAKGMHMQFAHTFMRIVQPVSHKQRILENGEVGNARHCTDFDRQVPFSSLAPTGEQMGGAIATIRLVLGSCSN